MNGDNDFFKETYLIFSRNIEYSFKACMRMVNRCAGIPKGTLITFSTPYYYAKFDFSPSYIHKVKKELPINYDFKINKESYNNNFTLCEYSKQFTDKLRSEDFIVKVETLDGDEFATAYGHGKKIGYSTNKNFDGKDGYDDILFEYFGSFDKWSKCCRISRNAPIDEIMRVLKNREEE